MTRRSFAQKRTCKPEKSVMCVDVPLDKEKGLEVPLRANKGIWKRMNDENGTCDTKILRRGLNVQG